MALHTYKLLVEYDGTDYAGFQAQIVKLKKPTIQEVLELNLSRMFAENVHINVAGRTDAGVHALGQVISFRSEKIRPLGVLKSGLNALLPDDISVLEVELAPDDFHARFSAKSRTYEYYLWYSPQKDAFFRERFVRIREKLDLEQMNKAAQKLLGAHDFATFGSQVPHSCPTIRRMHSIEIFSRPIFPNSQEANSAANIPGPLNKINQLIVIRITANAFLRRMVRMISASLLKVGKGEWDVEQPYIILQGKNPRLSPPPLNPSGLYLVSVNYE